MRLSFAAMLLSACIPAIAEETDFKGDVTDVVTIDTLDKDGPYNKIWEPFIAKWSDKHLVAAYGLQVTGKGDMGDIVCSISRDAGKSWAIVIVFIVAAGQTHFPSDKGTWLGDIK